MYLGDSTTIYGSDIVSEYILQEIVPLNHTLIALSVIACIFDLVTGGGSEQIEANSSLKDESWGVRPVWPAIEADLDTLN